MPVFVASVRRVPRLRRRQGGVPRLPAGPPNTNGLLGERNLIYLSPAGVCCNCDLGRAAAGQLWALAGARRHGRDLRRDPSTSGPRRARPTRRPSSRSRTSSPGLSLRPCSRADRATLPRRISFSSCEDVVFVAAGARGRRLEPDRRSEREQQVARHRPARLSTPTAAARLDRPRDPRRADPTSASRSYGRPRSSPSPSGTTRCRPDWYTRRRTRSSD